MAGLAGGSVRRSVSCVTAGIGLQPSPSAPMGNVGDCPDRPPLNTGAKSRSLENLDDLQALQRSHQILNQIVRILQADRQPDRTFLNTQPLAF
jgi:hypothetical protein